MTPAIASTVVVELTPPGRAAVAVLLVDGPDALRAAGECFLPSGRSPAPGFQRGQIRLGRWAGAEGEEVIVCRRSEEQIEIHCHGGAAAAGAIIERLVSQGCSQVSWQEWLRRSSPDPVRAAAQIALADAPTARTAAVLLDQYHGALTAAIRLVSDAIAAADWLQAAKTLDAVLTYRDIGLHLTTPWRVVIAGAPNVGKSSLINALAGYQRAIVSPLPGTTRDVVTVSTAIDGWPVQMADTAGLRTTPDELESAGVALAATTLCNADLVLVVHDTAERVGGRGDNDDAVSIFARLPPAVRVIYVRNKIDLLPVSERAATAGIDSAEGIPVSALTGDGISNLVDAIGQSLAPMAAPAGAAVGFTAGQIAALSAARMAIKRRDAVAAESALLPLLAS